MGKPAGKPEATRVSRITRVRTGISKIDRSFMIGAIRFRFPALTLFFRILTVTAQGASWGVAVLVLAGLLYRGIVPFPQADLYLSALIAPGLAWIVVKQMKKFWKRPRPFQSIAGYAALSRAPSDDSFPSGHAASAFAFLVAIFPFAAPAVLAIVSIWAALIAVSRWYLGVHYPTDIVVGAAIGCAAGSLHPYLFPLLPAWPPV